MRVSEGYLEQRRETIMRVAMRMYCEVGRDVSMARICEESGIAKGTIFRYFPTRDELFRQAFDACRNRALAMAGEGVDGELGDERTLKELVRQSFEWPLRFPDEFRFVVMYTDASAFFAMDEDEPGSVLFDALGETRFSELASQHLRPGIDPVLLMRLLSAQINTTCRYLIGRSAAMNEDELSVIVDAIYGSVFR